MSTQILPWRTRSLGEALEKTGAVAEARQELRKAVSVAAAGSAASFEQRLADFEKRVSAR